MKHCTTTLTDPPRKETFSKSEEALLARVTDISNRLSDLIDEDKQFVLTKLLDSYSLSISDSLDRTDFFKKWNNMK
jgi:hypothetical protein